MMEREAVIDDSQSQYTTGNQAISRCLTRTPCCANILFMEAARQLNESSPSYHDVRFGRKFLAVAAVTVVLAAIFGGTLGSSRKFNGLSATGNTNSYRPPTKSRKTTTKRFRPLPETIPVILITRRLLRLRSRECCRRWILTRLISPSASLES